jgi:thymidylate kinase
MANSFATRGLVPDLTVLLRYPVVDGLRRAAGRDASPDRIESLGEGFHGRVSEAFETFSTSEWQSEHPECGPIVALEGTGSEQEVAACVLTTLAVWWPGTFAGLLASH